jgi:hypothetical protein
MEKKKKINNWITVWTWIISNMNILTFCVCHTEFLYECKNFKIRAPDYYISGFIYLIKIVIHPKYKNLFPIVQKVHCVTITKTIQTLMFRSIITLLRILHNT